MIHDKIKDQDYIKQNEATILMPVYRWLVKPPMIKDYSDVINKIINQNKFMVNLVAHASLIW